MFPCERLFVKIGSDDFGDVVNAVPGRVGISLESVELFMLRDLGDESFEEIFAFGFLLRLGAFFLFQFFPFLFFDELLLFLSFSLNVLFHVHDFILNGVQFLVQLFVFVSLSVKLLLFFLFHFVRLLLVVLEQFGTAGCFGELPELGSVVCDGLVLGL